MKFWIICSWEPPSGGSFFVAHRANSPPLTLPPSIGRQRLADGEARRLQHCLRSPTHRRRGASASPHGLISDSRLSAVRYVPQGIQNPHENGFAIHHARIQDIVTRELWVKIPTAAASSGISEPCLLKFSYIQVSIPTETHEPDCRYLHQL